MLTNRKAFSISIYFSLLFIFMLTIFPLNNQKVHAVGAINLLSWDLVDSGKHSDWDGSTSYISVFKYGINQWNGYKAGVFRADTSTTVRDIFVLDYNRIDGVNASTHSDGYIYFNYYYMSKLSTTRQQNVATHELGHALGIDHNVSGTVMYKKDSTVNKITATDKSNYDAAYKKY